MNEKFSKTWTFISENVFREQTTDDLFNQYLDCDKRYDVQNAAKIRQSNLSNYLSSLHWSELEFFVVGEAPGSRGVRFSGVPFTNERQLLSGELGFSGERSSNSGKPKTSRSSEVFWKAMYPYRYRCFAWNCIPFHPHKHNDFMKNRTPKIGELTKYSGILTGLYELMDIKKVIAVGSTAKDALDRARIPIAKHVCHPVARVPKAEGFQNKIEEYLKRQCAKKNSF